MVKYTISRLDDIKTLLLTYNTHQIRRHNVRQEGVNIEYDFLSQLSANYRQKAFNMYRPSMHAE